MNLTGIKVTFRTTSDLDLNVLLKDGWMLIAVDEYAEGNDPVLKRSAYILGHPNPSQRLPKVIEETEAKIAAVYRSSGASR